MISSEWEKRVVSLPAEGQRISTCNIFFCNLHRQTQNLLYILSGEGLGRVGLSIFKKTNFVIYKSTITQDS